MEELLESGAVENTVVSRLGVVNNETVLGARLGGGRLGGLKQMGKRSDLAY